MHVHNFAAIPHVDKYRVFCVQFPYGNVLRWIRHEGRQETYSFGLMPSVSCPGIEFRFQSTKRWYSGVLKSQIAREMQIKTTTQLTSWVCIPFSSPPWLVWLPPGWSNLDRNISSSAFRHSEITRGILTQSRLSSCCRISSCHASSSSSRSCSCSSGFSSSWVPPLQQRFPQRCWTPIGRCSS